MEYYFKTDFQIVETFTDSTGAPIDLNDFDFELIYQTTGVNNYKASKKGTTFINCAIDETDSSKLNVIFQDHRLGCGQLHREIKIKVLNPLFKDYQQIMTHPFTEIYLVQNGGDQTTGYASAGIPIVLPYSETIVTDLADTDYFFGMSLSLKSFIKITWLDIKAKLKTYFDTLFEPKNSNIQSHISDTGIHVTSVDKSNFHSHSNKSDLDNVSGSNTGDETAQTIKNKLGITTLSGSNTGDQSASDFDIKDLTDSTNLRSTWNAKQDALSADVDYLTPTTASATYEPKKGENDNYVTDDEKTVIENTSGENTGDETAESIIDKIGTDGQIKSDYLPSYVDDVIEGYYFGAAFYSDSAHTELITAEQGKIYVDIPTNFSYRYSGSAYINISNPLDYSTNIEADKTSTTKVSAIKTLYDWATGKFIALSKLVTSWSGTPSHDNIPSEKLVKDSLNLKADIDPANGSTSALRALFIARGYDSYTNTYNCVYNTNTGYYEMNELTDITEAEMSVIYNYSTSLHNANLQSALSRVKCRTFYPLKYMLNRPYNISCICQDNNVLEAFFTIAPPNYPVEVNAMDSAFYGCVNLKIVNALRVRNLLAAANAADAFNGCPKLEECYLHNVKVDFSFAWSPLLSLASLQHLVTNRANGSSTITITVHETVWEKLDDPFNYPEWNALLVEAGTNYINFASASA